MSTVSVRYIVNDVDAAIAFYVDHLVFAELMHPDPAFAMLSRGDLRLVLVSPVPAGHPCGGSRPMPDGTRQQPGGWNWFMIEAADLAGTIDRLKAAGAHFRNEIVTGIGTRQILLEDPSGNVVELFEPVRPGARLTPSPAAAVRPPAPGPGT
jgi:catechol 2,3-dioxygenase-like lactoylglutathione lyase family enzyme